MGNRLKEVREAKGISKLKLSKLANVSRVTIDKIESNSEVSVNTSTLVKLAEALGVTFMDIFSP